MQQTDSPFYLERIAELVTLVMADAQLAKYDRRMDMVSWFRINAKSLSPDQVINKLQQQADLGVDRSPPCGTTACLAGHTILRWGDDESIRKLVNWSNLDTDTTTFSPWYTASRLLVDYGYPDINEVVAACEYLQEIFYATSASHAKVVEQLQAILENTWGGEDDGLD